LRDILPARGTLGASKSNVLVVDVTAGEKSELVQITTE
jgi:hypothetical protein